ncbi:type II toxin-antitoxin system death-on-curing family toxin [Sphingobacterium siyangense]|uniref:Death-on-curing protein n=1 Tax=Sphingobacterium siyangense TaxID=459529 RepID=A0A562M224_9SPHI|nr:type II toxin-antitoxin system death-on-curing family toxin [Sphingobacterium siyangense]TWI14007.1 death-on-curing protein [Sphingobacterium siyangense]
MGTQYFDVAHAIRVHDDIIDKSGGMHGIINEGLLASTLEHLQNDFYYESFIDKACHLFYSINKNHCFQDGNKRASIALTAYFLEINGLDYKVGQFMVQMENIAVHVADNKIDRDLLHEIIDSIVYESDYSESLKLKIFNALL